MFKNKNKRSRFLNSTSHKVLLLRPISSRQNILTSNSFLKKIIKKCIVSDERFNSKIVKIDYGDENHSSESNSKKMANFFFKNSSVFVLNRMGY